MANFERAFHFERFVPNIGNNRELRADQLTLQLACGMTKAELQCFRDAPKTLRRLALDAPPTEEDPDVMSWEQSADALAAEWAPFARIGPGSHSVNGKPLVTLRDYLRFAVEQPGAYNVFELITEIRRLNSVEGTRELFSPAPSGGTSSTARPTTAPTESQTGGR